MNLRPYYDLIVVKRTPRAKSHPEEKGCEGEVIAVGRSRRALEGDRAAGIKSGDRVLFGRHSGSKTVVAGSEYLILRDDELLSVIPAA